VHLERPDVSTSDARNALELVGLLEVVQKLPSGLDTPLVESGYPLTPSQARKLMLARAIAGRPRLLLIDGLLDALPDPDLRRVADGLFEPDQPWTLVVSTGRCELLQLATKTLPVGTEEPLDQPQEAEYAS
jgi:ABC-type bacteriocin/lantibiotic exporter with double-glycine peptidase domain